MVISSIPAVEHMGYSIKLPVGKILIDMKLLTLNMTLELVLLKTYYYLRHKKMLTNIAISIIAYCSEYPVLLKRKITLHLVEKAFSLIGPSIKKKKLVVTYVSEKRSSITMCHIT